MKKLVLTTAAGALFFACTQPKSEAVVEAPKKVEFAEERYIDITKQSLTKLAEGDVDAFMNNFADNAVFSWNNGDSIVSKQAITNYWKDRRANAIDTITFKNEAWLAIQANEPPTHLAKGVYVFNWAMFTITYSTGKSVTMFIHNAFHFDNNDKVDRATQFVDRVPIAAALAAK
jgi:ketosteroid isomerase-like protein